MKFRSWSLAVLLVAVALAGCTGSEKEGDAAHAPDGAAPAPGNGGTNTPPAAPPVAPPRPAPAPTADAGDIQGPFDKAWSVAVPAFAPRGVTVLFNLTGIEAGAPATARIHLAFHSPDGQLIRQATLGPGGEGDAVAWTFQPGEVMAAGTYTLHALAATAEGAPAGAPGIPSAGLAKYTMYAFAQY